MAPRRFCWRCGRRVESSRWRNCPSELIQSQPKSSKEGTSPIMCCLGDCKKAYLAHIAKKEPIISAIRDAAITHGPICGRTRTKKYKLKPRS